MKNQTDTSPHWYRNKQYLYQGGKFLFLSGILVYVYLKRDIPISLVLVFEIVLLIKILPITPVIERCIIRIYQPYEQWRLWLKRLVLFILWFLAFLILRFVIVDLLMVTLLNIPIEEDLQIFMDRYSSEEGVHK
jgi:hypothetical protein